MFGREASVASINWYWDNEVVVVVVVLVVVAVDLGELRAKAGAVQQPWKQASEASLMQGEFIFSLLFFHPQALLLVSFVLVFLFFSPHLGPY